MGSVWGLQVSSVELERVCQKWVPQVQELAAVGVPSPGGGPDRLVLFVVPAETKTAKIDPLALRNACQQAIRTHLNPLFRVDQVRTHPLQTATASSFFAHGQQRIQICE